MKIKSAAGKLPVSGAAKILAVLLILFSSSCGDMETILPVGRNYLVSAMWDGYSLDEYALIKTGETIQPFFVYPIKDDPDVASVTVTFSHAGETETHIVLEHKNGSLRSFTMPDFDAGPYLMIFQVYGKNQVLLSKSEKSVFYMADQVCEITDIGVCLPAWSVPSHLIPAGITVMLEAGIKTGPELDPYIYWYNGRSRIGEGKISDGANRLLWNVPSSPGFHNIRAEVIPFPPLQGDEPAAQAVTRSTRMHRGMARELSLPVTARTQLQGALEELPDLIPDDGEMLCDFRFAGNLEDSVNPEIAIAGKPVWHSAKGMYGLSAGPDFYRLPFVFPENRILFVTRFFLMNDGILFNFSFGTDDGFGNHKNNISISRAEDSFSFFSTIDEKDENESSDIRITDDYQILILDFSVSETSLVFRIFDEAGLLLDKIFDIQQLAGSAGILHIGGMPGVTGCPDTVMVLAELAVIGFDSNGFVESPDDNMDG